MFIQLFQFTLSDQSFKGTGQDRLPTTSSTWNPNISFIQMARHRRSSLYGRGIVNFADNYSLRSHIPLRSCLVGLRLWSDDVNWNSCQYIHDWKYSRVDVVVIELKILLKCYKDSLDANLGDCVAHSTNIVDFLICLHMTLNSNL